MTGKGKRMKKAAVLGLALSVLAAGTVTAYGAGGIDRERTDCRVAFTLDVEELSEDDLGSLGQASPDYKLYYEELAETLEEGSIRVELYRVAEVDADGSFRLLSAYRESGLEGLEAADADTTAKQWSDWAQAAAGIVLPEDAERAETENTAAGATGISPDTTAQIRKNPDGKAVGIAEGLRTGMYLVCVEPVETASNRYRFIPYLLSLPRYSYTQEGNEEWNYGDDQANPIYVGLKPEREDRYGDLVIEKILTSYNETLQGASFVFEVKAVKDQTLVYSDVVSLVFDGCGRETVTLEGIPLGAEVTVTEVYSGASYRETTSGSTPPSHSIVMTAEENSVSFENEYDGRLNGGGASVVNHFTYEKAEDGSGRLNWEALAGNNDSAAER